MSGPRIKILFYAINGIGLGHLTRLTAIARQLRDLLDALELKSDIQFLTTSDYPQLAHDFPVFKLPSKTTIRATGGSPQAFITQAKLIISNVMATFRPDILVTDTQPEGAFHEFTFLRDYAKRTVFIDRHKSQEQAESRMQQSHLGLYDLVLAPHRPDDYPGFGDENDKRTFVGAVTAYDLSRCWSRDAVRKHFGVGDDQKLIYLSAGGGGDPNARAEMSALIEFLAEDPSWFILAAYGPLCRDAVVHAANVIPLREPDAWTYFSGLDAAVSAAGYNTYEELLAARVPSLFYAQAKGMDRQDLRIEHGVSRGLHGVLAEASKERVRDAVRQMLDEADPFPQLQSRPRPRGALIAALEILRLHGDIANSPIHFDALHRVTARKALWAGEAEPAFSNVVRVAETWAELVCTPAELNEAACRARTVWSDQPDARWCKTLEEELAWARGFTARALRFDWNRSTVRQWFLAGLESGGKSSEARRDLDEVLNQVDAAYEPDAAKNMLGDLSRLLPRNEWLAALRGLSEDVRDRPQELAGLLDDWVRSSDASRAWSAETLIERL
ncbi:MAG: hypothetical protein AAF492_10345, partial [Verrucomicrobiota bacterium]